MAAETSSNPFRVVILGGGTAGWMCAAGLARLLDPADYAITLVESEEIGTVGVGEATLPHIKYFNDLLGIGEAQFMRETQATIKLGIEFVGWTREGERYIHPFGAFGRSWAGVEFQHYWTRARLNGLEPGSFESYSPAVAASRAGVFDHPSPDKKSLRSTYTYAYQFDAALYGRLLRNWALGAGVQRIEGKVQEVGRDGGTGDVAFLRLDSGELVQGDLFVDCSGFRSLLLGDAMQVGWEDWTRWLPCDRAFAVQSERQGTIVPYTRATAREAGWTWRIPLQHRTGNGYVFSSRYCDEERARETLLRALDGEPVGEPRLLRFGAGRRSLGWKGNCVAVGLSSGFLEPLESTSIHLAQAAVIDLANLMPAALGSGRIDIRLADEFNRLFEIHYDTVRDFLILHYIANQRRGEPLWDHLREMPIPDSLAHKIALFEECAVAPALKYGFFSRDSWLAVLIGQGIVPAGYARLADIIPLPKLDRMLRELEAAIVADTATLPSHDEFLARFCKQPPGGIVSEEGMAA